VTQYRRGTSAEYMARDMLREMGYPLVVRAGGSRGPVDLVAVGPCVRLIQVKRVKSGKGSFGQELEELGKVAVPVGCSVELWTYNDTLKSWSVNVVRRG